MSIPKATTIVFVPGAWHSPECYRRVSDILERDGGYKTDYVYLPSVGPEAHLPNFQADVDEVRKHVQQAVDEGEYVMVVVHSYGGIPTTQALEGLDLASRRAANHLPGGVTHLFFCCSFVVEEGQSLLSAFGSNNLPWFAVSEDQTELVALTPEKIFYNDLTPEDVDLAVAAIKPHSYQTLLSPLTFAAWKVLPSTYLYCLKDNAIPYPIQKLMVEGTAKDYNFETAELDASHSPFFSKPEETAKAIRVAAGEDI